MSTTIIIAIIAGVLLLGFILLYNSVVNKKNQVENSFASVDAMLKKRYDLIPNLVETVKSYMKHERETLNEITELRTQAMSGGISDDDKIDLDNKITRKLGGIMVAVENYPDLKANENFDQLQRTWTEVEEQISAARRTFNSRVTDYNNALEMVPTNMIGAMLGYRKKQWFEIPDTQRENISAGDMFNS